MESLILASGDNNNSQSPRNADTESELPSDTIDCNEYEVNEAINPVGKQDELTPEMIDEKESKIKDRIALCRDVIQSLKLELNEEKTKLQNESKIYKQKSSVESIPPASSGYRDLSDTFLDDLPTAESVYGVCVDNKLNCDQNLIEYEKQLQKYQSTLHMAQLEKKNAIRKQMLAKAYRLKLLEVENQCNIELLRVKQSLQCLEPLKMIASKWKTNTEDAVYDYNNFESIIRYPELSATSGSETNYFKDCGDTKSNPLENIVKDDDISCVETK